MRRSCISSDTQALDISIKTPQMSGTPINKICTCMMQFDMFKEYAQAILALFYDAIRLTVHIKYKCLFFDKNSLKLKQHFLMVCSLCALFALRATIQRDHEHWQKWCTKISSQICFYINEIFYHDCDSNVCHDNTGEHQYLRNDEYKIVPHYASTNNDIQTLPTKKRKTNGLYVKYVVYILI